MRLKTLDMHDKLICDQLPRDSNVFVNKEYSYFVLMYVPVFAFYLLHKLNIFSD